MRTVNLHSTFSEFGLDSIAAVELKQVIEKEYQILLTPVELKSMSFKKYVKLHRW